jgi:hypothetical protein
MTNPDPVRSRPDIPKDYGIPAGEEGMIDWRWAVEQLEAAKNYWVATVNPKNHPHAVPTWGAWIGNRLYFGGGPNTRHMRNLEKNPHIVIHLESADQVVIVEGIVETVIDPSLELVKQVGDIYEAKYKMREPPVTVAIPWRAFAWTTYPTTVTRFIFE